MHAQNESEGRLKLVPSLKVKLFLGDELREYLGFCLFTCFLVF